MTCTPLNFLNVQEIDAQSTTQSVDSTCKTNHPWNAPKYLKTKKDNQDFEAYQMAILLALINSRARILLEKPLKYSKVSITTPRLNSLIFDENDEVNVMETTEKQCKAVFDMEIKRGVSESTATRRFEKNRKVFLGNFLVDLAKQLGFDLTTEMARKSGKAMQLERLTEINFNGFIIKKNKLISIGKNLNSYFLSLSMSQTSTIVCINDEVVRRLFTQGVELA
ncbi:hypothetical protein EIN_505110 [Entamoeba invadens IP1]|uniref:Uncharacterized protein n=1 Tax=Entamoeba invadens IP1 TaxID=370355 RepID=A0A0A1UAV2_ENTIV|nr:hypothetical protein EIN_505110 [Entamoeba invadens IP1]ELP90305.1 hypothetical protein EIN_505110 [Entamoeba invadens IP1]|eukprot:XP_004257076.1 hypothetical protein EIN_505110 [Entamoeba invadens IP1]